MCSAWLDTNWRPNMFLREGELPSGSPVASDAGAVLEYVYGILAAPDPGVMSCVGRGDPL